MADTYGGEVVGKVLKEEGVEYFFGVHGGHMWPLLAGIGESDVKMVHMRHEQAGAYAAEAYSRAAQRPGVCFATAGVGQQNMAAGIAQAYYAQGPVLALFGQHAHFEDGLKGLQVSSGVELHRQHIKWGLRVIDGDRVAFWVRKALRDIMAYPQGPVVLDLPPVAVATKFDDLEMVDIFIPSSEWNYAALIKFKNFDTFVKYIKKTREEPITFFAKRGLHPPPKKLELLVDINQLE